MIDLTTFLLSPPVAFVLYTMLAAGLYRLAQAAADKSPDSQHKSELYASGEAAPDSVPPPGYQPFFRVALFFAIVHLGVIILASGPIQPITMLYLLGLVFVLLILILG